MWSTSINSSCNHLPYRVRKYSTWGRKINRNDHYSLCIVNKVNAKTEVKHVLPTNIDSCYHYCSYTRATQLWSLYEFQYFQNWITLIWVSLSGYEFLKSLRRLLAISGGKRERAYIKLWVPGQREGYYRNNGTRTRIICNYLQNSLHLFFYLFSVWQNSYFTLSLHLLLYFVSTPSNFCLSLKFLRFWIRRTR